MSLRGRSSSFPCSTRISRRGRDSNPCSVAEHVVPVRPPEQPSRALRALLIVGAVLSACLAAVGWALGFHDAGERE